MDNLSEKKYLLPDLLNKFISPRNNSTYVFFPLSIINIKGIFIEIIESSNNNALRPLKAKHPHNFTYYYAAHKVDFVSITTPLTKFNLPTMFGHLVHFR